MLARLVAAVAVAMRLLASLPAVFAAVLPVASALVHLTLARRMCALLLSHNTLPGTLRKL